MHEDIIMKIWGTRKRLLLLPQAEIDLLYLDKDTACSIHTHKTKINYFYSITASVKIKTDLGEIILNPGEHITVLPNIKHQFIVLESGILLEIAFVNEGEIDSEDIKRQLQGGKFIDNKFYTLEQLKNNNWLEYNNEQK
jgi:quercetin dioxygenase-like cupin family protein